MKPGMEARQLMDRSMKQKCQHDGNNSSTTRPGPMKQHSSMTVADEAQRMLDRWNPAPDAPNQWNQANKSWRTNRPKLFSFFSTSLQSRRWAHI
jgi:hypothetical protein